MSRPPAEPPFSADEFAEFEREDAFAGRIIGKLLVGFFLFSAVVMALVTWWTSAAIGGN